MNKKLNDYGSLIAMHIDQTRSRIYESVATIKDIERKIYKLNLDKEVALNSIPHLEGVIKTYEEMLKKIGYV